MNKKIEKPDSEAERIVVFQEQAIRRTWHENTGWFAIVNVAAVLTDFVQPEGYVKDLQRRDKELVKGWGKLLLSFELKQRAVHSVSIALILKAHLPVSEPERAIAGGVASKAAVSLANSCTRKKPKGGKA